MPSINTKDGGGMYALVFIMKKEDALSSIPLKFVR